MKQLRVLQVTESMGGGVLTLISRMCKLLQDVEIDVGVLYAYRKGTSAEEVLKTSYFKSVPIREIRKKSRIQGLFSLFYELRLILASNDYDILHLHSSFAGFLGRLAKSSVSTTTKIFYSPHGFSFLNTNMNFFVRKLFFCLEKYLAARDSTIIATCKSELMISGSLRPARQPKIIQTGVPKSSILKQHRILTDAVPTIAMIGRICVQKNPFSFNKLAEEFRGKYKFLWIGDFDEDHPLPNFQFSTFVGVTGWLDYESLRQTLKSVDLLVFQSLWEGYALSIPLAQSFGIPVITNRSPGNIDTIEHGNNGLICENHEDTTKGIIEILENRNNYENLSRNSLIMAEKYMSDDDLGLTLRNIYCS